MISISKAIRALKLRPDAPADATLKLRQDIARMLRNGRRTMDRTNARLVRLAIWGDISLH